MPGEIPYEIYSEVRLVTNRFIEEGVSIGAIGYIIEVYEKDRRYAYEIEFSTTGGITIAQIVATREDLELVDEG